MAFLFFGGLSGLAFWKANYILNFFFGFLSVLGLGFLLLPGPLAPAYRAWLKVAHCIGTIFTMLILTLSYYLVITPAALLKRVFGGPPLPLKPDPDAASYWRARTEPAQPKERFYKRY